MTIDKRRYACQRALFCKLRKRRAESGREAARVSKAGGSTLLDKRESVCRGIALSGNAPICPVSTIHTHPPRQSSASWRTMLLCYLIPKMRCQLDSIPSLRQVLPHNRFISSPHRWHPLSEIPFSRTSYARHSGLECSLTGTKNRFRRSGKRSFQHRHRRAIQPAPRLMTSLYPMRPLPTRARQNVHKLRRR
jgi:hypothetical protein